MFLTILVYLHKYMNAFLEKQFSLQVFGGGRGVERERNNGIGRIVEQGRVEMIRVFL